MNPLEARTHAAFVAVMWALSYPGRPQPLPATGHDALVCIGESLLDLETSYYTPDPVLDRELARTGARGVAIGLGSYNFYPELRETEVEKLGDVPVGTLAYPDRSATLVVAASVVVDRSGVNGALASPGHARAHLRLRGPGIPRSVDLLVGGVPRGFWHKRAEAIRYPLGWDVLLVSDGQVVGLPRTTAVEVL
jgi:alpha-D-ribose 1-methylphosphonate 5-triphosphate synthase subunit PhnH